MSEQIVGREFKVVFVDSKDASKELQDLLNKQWKIASSAQANAGVLFVMVNK